MTFCTAVATFAERLRSLRQGAGISQETLAARAHLSQRTIARLEAGGPPPRRSTIALIAGALGITVDELLANGEAA